MAVAIRADQLAPPFVFATLKPSNPLAKLAFSHTFEQVSDVLQAYQRRMLVEPEQIYDKDILRLRLKRNPGFLPLQSDINDDVSESSTDPGSGTEQDWRGLGMVWTGCYPFDLGDPPDNRITGWTVGKGRDEINIDFLINTPLRRDQVRGYHALFNLHRDTGYLYIMSRASSTTSVTVNGHEIARGKMHALNQSPMTIRFGPLEYIFEYAETARSPAFYSRLQGYMKNHLGVTESDFSLTPTPTGQVRTVGDWTLGKSLGRGSYGKVYAATNSKNHIVAIKLVDRKSKKDAVNKEIETLKALTDLAEDKDDEGRLLRLRDVIYQNGKEDYSSTRFEDIILVLEPATPDCFDRLTTDATDRLGRCVEVVSPTAIALFHDALKGVDFLHSYGWVHSDLKPGNIGIKGARAVLLDNGGSWQFDDISLMPPNPGCGGTIWYLAPEREMQGHSSEVDIWSMGIMLFELVYGYHPWKFSDNPWRPGSRYEKLRPQFHKKYREAMEQIRGSENSKVPQIGDLLLQMLMHQWADGHQASPRISIECALKHSCWQFFEETEPAMKKMRSSSQT